MPTTRLRFGAFMTQKRHSGFEPTETGESPIALRRPHLGIPPAPKNHAPDPIRQFAPNLEASHRLLMVKGGDSVRCSRRRNMDVDPERRKSGVSHLSFSLTLSTGEQHVMQCRSIRRLGQPTREPHPTGRIHGGTDQRRDVEILLANTEPSTHGTLSAHLASHPSAD
jgi:hypothetical protein